MEAQERLVAEMMAGHQMAQRRQAGWWSVEGQGEAGS